MDKDHREDGGRVGFEGKKLQNVTKRATLKMEQSYILANLGGVATLVAPGNAVETKVREPDC